jgi:LPS-assembly protein
MRAVAPSCLALIVVAAAPAPAVGQERQQSGGLGSGCNFSSAKVAEAPTLVRPGIQRWILEGDVTMTCETFKLQANRVEYLRIVDEKAERKEDADWIELTGNVALSQSSLTIYATRARINQRTRLGTFYDAVGFTRIHDESIEKSQFGGGEPEFAFGARLIEKTGPKSYRIEGASVTSCMQPVPRWLIGGSSGAFTLDEHVTMRNAVMRIKGVPVLYLPYMRYPITREERSTGILMPSFGSSTIGGFTLSNAFFWAINRSQDATFYHDYFSNNTQGFGVEYRYAAAPGSGGNVVFHALDERARLATDGVSIQPAKREYELRATLNQALPRGFRLIGNVNYFTDATTRQIFQQDVYTSSSGTRTVLAELTGNVGRYRMNAGFQQVDVFSSLSTASRSGYAPRVGLSMGSRPIGASRVYVSANTEAAYVLQQSDLAAPETNRSLWRLDASPSISAPISNLSFLRAGVSANWRVQYWSASQDAATGQRLDEPISRQLFTARMELAGPTFSAVFRTPNRGYAEGFKHIIEPTFSYSWTSPFSGFNNLVQVDAAEGHVSSQVTYGLSNQLRAKRRATSGPGPLREIVRVDISQTYYGDARASSFDPNYQTTPGLAPPTRFSPVQLTATARPTDVVGARVRLDVDPVLRRIRTIDASGDARLGGVGGNLVQLRLGWTKQHVLPGVDPNFAVHGVNGGINLRRTGGRIGGTYDFNYDARRGVLLRQHIGAFYNAQCCGITVDYHIADLSFLGPRVRSNRTLGITFSLAGVGSFVSPLGAFGR